LRRRQVFVKSSLGPKRVPSGMVTSLTKAARSHGTSVCVGMGVLVGVLVGSASVGSWSASVSVGGSGGGGVSCTARVKRASTVLAAKVGNGSSVFRKPGKLHALRRSVVSSTITIQGRKVRDMFLPPDLTLFIAN
jgi:hypothetical protein